MTFEQLCEIVRAARDRALVRIDYSGGVPLQGRFGTRFQEEIINSALAHHIIRKGQIVVEDTVISVSSASGHAAGLRATDTVKLASIRRRLHAAVMHNFFDEVLNRWSAEKVRRGEFAAQRADSELSEFLQDEFGGFT